jgi:hypothetical protein
VRPAAYSAPRANWPKSTDTAREAYCPQKVDTRDRPHAADQGHALLICDVWRLAANIGILICAVWPLVDPAGTDGSLPRRCEGDFIDCNLFQPGKKHSLIKIKVKSGSGPDQYELKAYRVDDKSVFCCTCHAAESGMACRHRLELLITDPKDLPGNIAEEAQAIQELFRGSKVEARIKRLIEWQARFEAAKKRIESIRKNIGRELAGGKP